VIRNAVPVPRGEAAELVNCTKTIDGAIVNILAMLVDREIAQDIVGDLAEIASAALYVRGVAEQALEKANDSAIRPERGQNADDDEPSAGDVVEADDTDPVALAKSMQQRRHGGS